MNSEFGITNANLMRTFPPVLALDKSLQALALAISELLSSRVKEINRLRIYTRIDELPEDLVDILAHDFKVDWYIYDYPVEAKRQLVKDNFDVHRHIGTRGAVKKALSGVFPMSSIEEWFEYGGDPYHFRVFLDVTDTQVTASYTEIIKTLNMYKSLRSKLEEGESGIIFFVKGVIQLQTGYGYLKFHTGMTGQRVAGTYPLRSTVGSYESDGVSVDAYAGNASFESALCGSSFYQL